ncbi:hypothetical protein QJS10_CPB18g01316 [Acorus calamus]|uniref:shikimate kinase n=1 Tax=Acorus calamus TaxID=4465 RepID=A0AAV9CMH0_ACOCL|nr:hypothetical protein QJS10_CPB18g01316 [Acorus calamus]
METSGALGLQSCPRLGLEGVGRRPGGFVRFSRGFKDEKGVEKLVFRRPSSIGRPIQLRFNGLDVSCSYKNSAVESESVKVCVDEALILKRKSEEVAPYLNGQCIYLIGMMGSGKTTVGKILSEVLGYSFFDSDKLVEQAVGATSVAQIFKEHSEDFFRENESEVLRELSSMHQLVVATGGGVVIRPINWRHMKKGITIWLDVPLEALARRIAAVGTASRPLLHHESGDAYTKALLQLNKLYQERGEYYTNADATVSLQDIADEQANSDVSALTPTAIAIEALIKIKNFLTTDKSNGRS